MSEGKYGFETLAIHAGAAPDPTTGARATPIYQTTAYVFDDVDHAAALFNLRSSATSTRRLTNPTVSVLEERVASARGRRGGLRHRVRPRGAVPDLLRPDEPGDEFVASRKLYGGSINQFGQSFPQLRLEGHLRRPATIRRTSSGRSTPRTKAIFIESLANPGGIVADIEAIAGDRARGTASR